MDCELFQSDVSQSILGLVSLGFSPNYNHIGRNRQHWEKKVFSAQKHELFGNDDTVF